MVLSLQRLPVPPQAHNLTTLYIAFEIIARLFFDIFVSFGGCLNFAIVFFAKMCFVIKRYNNNCFAI